MKKIIVGLLIVIIIILGIIAFVEYGKKQKIDNLSQEINTSISVARQKGNVAMIKANVSSLRVEAEMIYDRSASSYLSLCRGGLLNDSNTQIKSSLDKILESLGLKNQSDIGVKCFSSKGQYAISVAVNSPQVIEGLAYCVDQTGYAGKGVADDKTFLCINK